MYETKQERESSLKLLCLIAVIARTARSNEVCSELVYLGGDFGTHRGRFSSPGYPSGTYPSREQCTWIVKVPLNYRVLLHFDDVDVESCRTSTNNCTCDHVAVADGQLLIDRLLAKICGNTPPPDIISSGRFVRVDLVTDATNGRKGFSAQFYSVSSDGATPTSLDNRDANKNKKTIPPFTDQPGKGGSSTVMIAVVCSLVGAVIIGVIFIIFHMKKRKQTQANQAHRRHQVPSASSQRTRSEQLQPPPPYSSVVSGAPPAYSSTVSIG